MKWCQIVAGQAPPKPPSQPPIVGSTSSISGGFVFGLSVNMPTDMEYCGIAPMNHAWDETPPEPSVPALAINGRPGHSALGTPVPEPAGVSEVSNDRPKSVSAATAYGITCLWRASGFCSGMPSRVTDLMMCGVTSRPPDTRTEKVLAWSTAVRLPSPSAALTAPGWQFGSFLILGQ